MLSELTLKHAVMNDDQVDEKEALVAIYEDDPNFTVTSDTVFCYKYTCEQDELKSFMIQVAWPKDYPDNEPAIVDLDVFYNSHITQEERDEIVSLIRAQYSDWEGMAMTFSIISHISDNINDFRTLIKNERIEKREEKMNKSETVPQNQERRKDDKGTMKNMSKAQKRKFYDKYGNIEEKPRGWDWVDVIKHLSKTGTS